MNSKIVFCGDRNILFFFGANALALKNRIYVKESYWKKLIPHLQQAIVIHEMTHILQQDKGFFWWLMKYIFSKKFRFKEEVQAYGAELTYRLSQGELKLRLMYAFSDEMSGRTYFNMISFDKAYEALEDYLKQAS